MSVDQLHSQQFHKVMTVEDAVSFLEGLRLPTTFAGAREYLQNLWHTTNLLSLYRHYFPQEFSSSQASASIRIGGARGSFRQSNELYSPKESEFLHLVDQQLFSIYLDYYLEEREERQEFILIPSYGPDWWDYRWEDLPGGWQTLLILTGCAEVAGNFNNVEGSQSEEIQTALAGLKGHKPDWEKLKALCLTRGEPLIYLPLAYDMLDHDTGNIFLDPTDESPAEDLEWSVTDMDFLIEQHKEAVDSLEKVEKLLDWLTTSPDHLEEVIELWNECLSLDTPTTGS